MKILLAAALAMTCLCGQAVAQSEKPDTDVGAAQGTPSDKLSETGGVIHPRDGVDPKMQKPAPSTGTTPVIRPPGSTGDDTTAQPK